MSGLVNNVLIVTLAPDVDRLVPTGGANLCWWARAIMADLAGDATAIAASANIVVLGIAERYSRLIRFWEFTKHRALVAAATVVLSLTCQLLR